MSAEPRIPTKQRKLFLLPGMTPGARIYQKLLPLLDGDAEVIDWIHPEKARTIAEYAQLLADKVDFPPGCDVAGVSFGGMVARELSEFIGARVCFVISSVASSSELSPSQRWQGRFIPAAANEAILSSIGTLAGAYPGSISAPATARARRYGGNHGKWFCWATSAALRWLPERNPQSRVVRIHGDRDLTFPRGHHHADHVVYGAGHMLAFTHCRELSEIIRREREELAGDTRTNMPRFGGFPA